MTSVKPGTSDARRGDEDSGDDTFVFRVCAIDQHTVRTVMKKLQTKLDSLVDTEELSHDVIATIGTDYIEKIVNAKTKTVKIDVGK